jgi:nucleotide-binding universal stress UspA family protein
MSIVENILFATDFSEHSQRALEVARDLALAHHAGLTLLHVHETTPFELPDGYVQNMPSQLDRTYDELNARLSELERSMRSAGVARVKTRILQGSVVDQIVEFSKAFNVVVLGTQGLTGLQRFVMGSVAQQVLERASAHVVVVRPAKKPA